MVALRNFRPERLDDSDQYPARPAAAQGTDGATRKIRKFDALDGHLVDQVMENSADFCGDYFLATLKGQPPRGPLS